MKGIIIAGGLGTRLRPLTYSRPKHLLPVANCPFLEYQIALLKQHGVDEVVFATNYFADMIENHFGDGSHFGIKLRYAIEDQPLGTAGAIRNAANLLTNETIIVFNGDILTDFDLSSLISFHKSNRAKATIALRPVNKPHAFGALSLSANGRVTNWYEPTEEEKRQVAAFAGRKSADIDYINAGIYILDPEIVQSIPTGRPVSVERETYPSLIASKGDIFGYAPEGFWLDIGHPEQYLAANLAVAGHLVSSTAPHFNRGLNVCINEKATVDEVTVLGSNVTIGSGTSIMESIILNDCDIADNCTFEGVICEENVTIEADVTIKRGAVIAAGSIIKRGTRI